MRGIYKVYPPEVIALENVDWELRKGEIHSIVGENGAGKSTLMKILSGLIKPSAGSIYINGKEIAFSAPHQAMKKGIGMVHQEFMLVPSFKIYENVILGDEDSVVDNLGLIDSDRARRLVDDVAKRYGFRINVDATTSGVSVAMQQKVEILKQLYRDVEILIMDEPTAVLTPQETEELFDRLKELNEKGKTVVFISHKLDEVLQISDRITVLRKGRKVGTVDNKGITKKELANMMVGRDVVFTVSRGVSSIGKRVLSIKELSVCKDSKAVLGPLSFDVHEGEIVGIAGIEGNGQFELVEALIGTSPIHEGKLYVGNVDITNMSIRGRRRYIGFVSQDRKYTGLALQSTTMKNIIMTHHIGQMLKRMKFTIDWDRAKGFSRRLVDSYAIVCRDVHESVSTLSGGNQQKVVVAREFSLDVPFLLLDQPTRGLDVGTIEFIHQRILQMRGNGMAILLISAELDELFTLSDKIYVMRGGKIVVELAPSLTTKEEVGAYMLGVGAHGQEQ